MQSPPFPAGLTAREVEVLRLLAQGWTDAQIAEHLVLSPRTVNRHTASLYSKLGVSSRAAATRYAIEHHVIYGPCSLRGTRPRRTGDRLLSMSQHTRYS